MNTISKIALWAALLSPATAAQADSFYCGQWIASKDMSVAELLAKCGEPTHKESHTVDVYGRNATDTGTIKTGESTVERWIYDRGSQRFSMVVTIVDGTIKSIDTMKPF